MDNNERRLELSLSRRYAGQFAIMSGFVDGRRGEGRQQDNPGTVVDRIQVTGTILVKGFWSTKQTGRRPCRTEETCSMAAP
jgi:hypothetical protein